MEFVKEPTSIFNKIRNTIYLKKLLKNSKPLNKILFILMLPPPYGGGEIVSQYLYEEIKGIDGFGFYIVRRKNHNKTKQGRLNLSNFIYGFFLIFSLAKIIAVQRPNAIYLGISKTIFPFIRDSLIVLFSNLLGIRVYAEFHGMNFLFLNNRIFRIYFYFVINKISKLRVLSSSIKDYVIKAGYHNKVYVVDNGISISVGEPKKMNNDEIRILYLGVIDTMKGFSDVIEVLNRLSCNNRIRLKLNVVGEWRNESYKNECMNLINKYGLNQKIKFYGLLINQQKLNIIKSSDIHLHLTKWDGQPLSIIECMSQGVPSISTKVGAIPEMIENNVNGFLVDDVLDETVQLIEKIVVDSIQYHLISKNCIEHFKKRFTAEVMARKIIKMVDE